MLELFKLDSSLRFPSVDFALDEPNGLLAFGGDLSPHRLIEAYENGIFPWFSEGEPLLWWSPNPRGVIFTHDYKASKSLKKSIRKHQYTLTMNHAFEQVIQHCARVKRGPVLVEGEAQVNGTWISSEMIAAYIRLHKAAYAQSVEVWDSNNELVGGLYGVTIGGAFCGESMFHLKTDASKAAFAGLIEHMKTLGLKFIDCQMQNPHLQTLGCIEVERDDFLSLLYEAKHTPLPKNAWARQSLRLSL